MIKWKKRNTVNTTYVSTDGEWQIRRQGRKHGAQWSVLRAKADGDAYEFIGSRPTRVDAMATAEHLAGVN